MSDRGSADEASALQRVRLQAASGMIHVTRHALGEMSNRGILLQEIAESIAAGEMLENYPDHQRGPCCLVSGRTLSGRDLHVVCTTAQPSLIIITAYEPCLPKWKSPRERNR